MRKFPFVLRCQSELCHVKAKPWRSFLTMAWLPLFVVSISTIIQRAAAASRFDILGLCHAFGPEDEAALSELHEKMTYSLFTKANVFYICERNMNEQDSSAAANSPKLKYKSNHASFKKSVHKDGRTFSLAGKDVTASVIGLEPYIVYTPDGVKGAEARNLYSEIH